MIIDITELREAQQALLEAEQARAELLKTMTTIANHLLRSTDYRLILPNVLQLLGEAASADRCSLVQNITDLTSGKPAVRMHAEWCRPGIQASIAHTPELESALLWEDFAQLYERLIQGETVQFFGTDLCASLRELFEAQGNTAMLMVPIVVQGEFWGMFGFNYCTEVRRFEELDQLIFAIAVDSIAAAIERQQQEEALLQAEQVKQAAIIREQEKAAQLQVAELAKANDVLKKTLDTLATEPELDCFLRHMLSVIARQMNAPACLLWLFNESLQTATLHLSCTNGQVNFPARFNADRSHPLCLHSPSWVFCTEQRQPYLVEVATPPFTRASCAYLTRSGVKAILIVPLWLGDRLIGSFAVRLREARDFAPNELELVQALVHQATLALQLMQLAEQASHSAVLEERNRMAREIHDVLAQAFTGVVVQLEAAKMITPQDVSLQPLMAQAQELARAGLVEARRSVWSLRPQALENTNLRSALEKFVQALTHNTSVQVQLKI
ncbi:MAG: GAF domain-containing protein [Chroococcidiopsidaceae cyanobacterium CP_BM_RX_35]|nr:GAF domain-containing protein [Chroococcidiopsidaceae cyanobacterium CP_BM_RX_35]